MVKYSAALDLLYSALSDSSRRAMLSRLAQGPATVSELARPLGMSLPAVTKHLVLLEKSGVVTSRKQGRVRVCQLEGNRLLAAQVWIETQRQLWEARFNRMDAYILEKGNEDER